MEVGHTVQIAANELHAHCGPDAVVSRVNADVPGYDWRVEAIFFHSSCIHICKEQLQEKRIVVPVERELGLVGRITFLSGTAVSYHHPYKRVSAHGNNLRCDSDQRSEWANQGEPLRNRRRFLQMNQTEGRKRRTWEKFWPPLVYVMAAFFFSCWHDQLMHI